MKGLWHFAQGQETKRGQDWAAKKLGTAGTLQAWLSLLWRETQDPRTRLCFQCVYEMAKETGADRRAFLRVTIMQGGAR